MKLTVLERLMLLQVLPQEGDLTTLRIVRALRQDLSFSEKEHKALKFVQTADRLTWDQKANVVKDVPMGLKATNLIVGALTTLSEQKKLTEQHLTLCEKFVGAEKAEPPG